jgi:hypothetical protein
VDGEQQAPSHVDELKVAICLPKLETTLGLASTGHELCATHTKSFFRLSLAFYIFRLVEKREGEQRSL